MPGGSSKAMLDLAARLALRALGDVEPNPLVGCVIADRRGDVIGLGHHRRFGGPHAEREALADCRRRGFDPRGATMYVTLEPCAHHGKTPPCTDAIIEAGVARVVAARADPNPASGGGAEVLRREGIGVEFCTGSALALCVGRPFVKRITEGLPWVIAKWAQTPGGDLTAAGSRWISGPAARRRVHRLRARVDAVMTGLGTVLADDPLLTARGVRVHRPALRVVATPDGRVPDGCALVRTACESPVLVAYPRSAAPALPGALTSLGLPPAPRGVDPRALLAALADRFGATMVLVEAGPTLLGALFELDLVDQAIVHVGGAASRADDDHPFGGPLSGPLADRTRFEPCRRRAVFPDLELHYLRARASA